MQYVTRLHDLVQKSELLNWNGFRLLSGGELERDTVETVTKEVK